LIGKPDAWKLARPVWGWGQGETPWPTPLNRPPRKNKNKIAATVELGLRPGDLHHPVFLLFTENLHHETRAIIKMED